MNVVLIAMMAACSSFTAISHAEPASMDCSTMSPDEQQFAMQLTDANKAMFCGQMSADQRMAAMQMTKTPDASGSAVTPDQAVEKMAPTAAPKSTGGCPVQ